MASLARPSGAFAMLAMDQRVSLETMFHNAGRDTSTGTLDAFRPLVLDAAAPHVSAILLDRGYLERAGVGTWARRVDGSHRRGRRPAATRGHAGPGFDHRPRGGERWPSPLVPMP